MTRPTEKEIYEKAWSYPQYRVNAPGELAVTGIFLNEIKPEKGATVLDFGCGTGRSSVKMAEYGLDVTLLDIALNCRDSEAEHLKFFEVDMVKGFPHKARYGVCTDVMEHIAPEDVDSVLSNIKNACKNAFFMIATVPDVFGGLVGHPLHLTVKPGHWWMERFNANGYVVLKGMQTSTNCYFYVETPWIS